MNPAVPPVHVRVSDAVVARVAARCAGRVPGVVELHADLAQALLGIADSVLGSDASSLLLPAGVAATVDGRSAQVSITVVTRLGQNCRELAEAVQRAVVAELRAYAGIEAVVTVTVAEILLT